MRIWDNDSFRDGNLTDIRDQSDTDGHCCQLLYRLFSFSPSHPHKHTRTDRRGSVFRSFHRKQAHTIGTRPVHAQKEVHLSSMLSLSPSLFLVL